MIRRAAQLPETFAPWIMHLPGPNGAPHRGAVTIFPHAGGSASSYKELAFACCTACDTFIVQYPRRADRLGHPAAQTVPELARGLFEAGPWRRVEPLRLFGHSMGALVAFEFARLAEEHGIAVHKLWVSAGPPPATIAASPDLPTGDEELRADLADLGGTDARLLADEEFAEMLTTAARADY
jgi:surfactin synthase thioesterase subunit